MKPNERIEEHFSASDDPMVRPDQHADDFAGYEDAPDEYLEPGENPAAEEMDALMDQYLDQMPTDINQGQVLTVTVVAVKEDGVLVDLGEKSEGFIPLREFPVIDNKPQVAVGNEIEVVVKGHDPVSGLINLSHREALRRRAWQMAEEAFNNRTPLKGIVTRAVKGGVILDIGTTAFLPASQIDLRRVNDFESWIGREVEGYVIEFAPAKRRIILSRRQLLEDRRAKERTERFGQLAVGQDIEVTVKRIVDFGAFVDLGGVDGLIPRSEISWQRNARPEDFLKVDETITVRIIELNLEQNKVTLSRRQLTPNPWDTAVQRYPVGSSVTGQVVSLTNYGAFVRLEEGLDGMIHVTDMGWDSAGKKPSDFVQVGMEVTAQVLGVDPGAHRISLGLKQLTRDPWEDIEARYPKGRRIKGPVTGLTKYGAFIELEPGIEGMVHVSDFSWEKRINQPRDMVKKGDEVEAVVLEIDRQRRRISLGIKQLTESPMVRFTRDTKVGDIVEGEVTGVTDFGVFVKLASGVEGFMHVSQLDQSRVDNPAQLFKVGENVIAKITKIDADTGKVSLSRKQMLKEQERKTVQSYMRNSDKISLNSMGELLGNLRLEDNQIVGEPRKPGSVPDLRPEMLEDDLPAEPAPKAQPAGAGEHREGEPATEMTTSPADNPQEVPRSAPDFQETPTPQELHELQAAQSAPDETTPPVQPDQQPNGEEQQPS